jgi:hypothetical protein
MFPIDPRMGELALLCLLACVGVALAWACDEEAFVAVFAVEASWAFIEALE